MTLEAQLRASVRLAERCGPGVFRVLKEKGTNMTALAKADTGKAGIIERVMLVGDLGKLSAQERVEYYGAVCGSLGLNPLTRPFDYLQLSGKLVMYANKGCTDQLRNIHRVSVEIVKREYDEKLGVFTVTARATKPNGRADEDVGSVVVANLKGEALANATMKAHTKAKRRVTMSICGLSMLDESELDSVRDARPVRVDFDTGEVLDTNGGASDVQTWNNPLDGQRETPFASPETVGGFKHQIEDATTLDDLKGVWKAYVPTTDSWEDFAPEDRKDIQKLYKRRERELQKLAAQARAAIDTTAEDL